MEEPFLNVKKIEELEPDDDLNNENSEEKEIQEKPINMSPGAVQLRKWLNKTLKIEMSDGRVLIGVFLCTDRDANVILGSCSEYLPEESVAEVESTSSANTDEPRMLGLVMVPGKHIVNICIDQTEDSIDSCTDQPLDISIEAVM